MHPLGFGQGKNIAVELYFEEVNLSSSASTPQGKTMLNAKDDDEELLGEVYWECGTLDAS